MRARGEGIAQSRLTEAMVIDARCWAADGYTLTEIIAGIGIPISRPTLNRAINGQTWTYLNELFPPPQRRPRGSVAGRPHPRRERA